MLQPAHPAAALRAVTVLAVCLFPGGRAVPQTPADRPDLPPPGRLIDVGHYRLHLYCTGTRSPGDPTVVLSAGAGDFAVDWGLVQPAVAESARVCSYDRAGAGWSDPGPEPRTLVQEAVELQRLLQKAGELPPYVMAGHSVGALVVRRFQELRPGDVAGVVLVDPTHEDARLGYRGRLVRLRTLATGRAVPPARSLDEGPPSRATGPLLEACRAAAAAAAIDGPFSRLTAPDQHYRLWALRHSACLADQEDYLPDELAAMYARRRAIPQPLGRIPLVVVAAVPGGAPPGVSLEEWRREKADLMRDLAGLSSRGRAVSVTGGHHIHLEQPAVVVRAIQAVIREAGNQ